MATLKGELKEQNKQAFMALEGDDKTPAHAVEGWIYNNDENSSDEITKTADADARNAAMKKSADAYKRPNPLKSSLEYLGTSEGFFGDEHYYSAKTKFGSFMFSTGGATLNESARSREDGIWVAENNLNVVSDEMKKHILALCQPVFQDEQGKWRSVAENYGFETQEKAQCKTQLAVGGAVCTYYALMASEVYLEQNKKNYSANDYKIYKDYLNENKNYAVANLQKYGITVNQQTGDMKRVATHATNNQVQRDVVSR